MDSSKGPDSEAKFEKKGAEKSKFTRLFLQIAFMPPHPLPHASTLFDSLATYQTVPL